MSDFQEQALPLFQAPYNTNRLLIALLEVSLLLLNSFALHQYTASKIIDIPQTKHLLDNLRHFNNRTQTVSDSLIDEIEQQNQQIRTEINATFQRRFDYTMTRIQHNELIVTKIVQEEKIQRAQHGSVADYLQAWDRARNPIPYLETATEDDMTLLETTFFLQNSDTVQDLSSQYQELESSIHASVDYHLEYLHNLTGRPLDFLEHIQHKLQAPNLRGAALDLPLEDFRDNLIRSLQEIRENFQIQYEFLKARLEEAQLAFEELAMTYQALYDLVVSLNAALRKIHLGTLGFTSAVVPDIDLNLFPPVELYRPDIVALPSVDFVLQPLDDLIIQLDADFDVLGDEILASLQNAITSNLQQIYNEFAKILLLDDYDPPPIIFRGLLLSLQDALSVQSELNLNITHQVTLPSVPYISDVPPINIPPVTPFADVSLSFARPSIDLLSWRIPDLGEYVLLWDEILVWVAMYWSIIEPFVINVYRALKRLFEYFEGTAVPLPVIDLRTVEEKIEKKKQSQKSKLQDALAVFFDPVITFVVTRVIPVTIFIGLVMVGCNYFINEYSPNCIQSNKGTSIGNDLIGPIIYNRAANGAESRATELSVENHAYIQSECQTHYASSYDTYNEQVIQYSTSKEQAKHFATRIALVQRTVDLKALCDQYTAACKTKDSNFICPLHDDNSHVMSPCSFETFTTKLSSAELLDPLQPCDDLPDGNVAHPNLDVLRISPQESWCEVEWWLLSRGWRIAYVFGSYIIFFLSFSLLMDGIQVFQWRRFRPEEYHIQCTSTRSGKFTQPDYSDESAKAMAIEEWEQSNRIVGFLKLAAGIVLLLGWVALITITFYTNTTPIWKD
eukprot:CAMPEP_0202445508 /NCGR_PEP_ID=MMETSP1360-20130828/4319_1 /ASSEMBLY_ACC=CAM_ASM_000848 /TAXON_ID=515479 /ORGANISM="Licmophora paradoxa, Strain CCMP2313" /LENGTH=844 /DNA_ID=CAMNT_0049061805 /DNA_START=61 /DNA_END=2595 /DNA_ORIENTATION=+